MRTETYQLSGETYDQFVTRQRRLGKAGLNTSYAPSTTDDGSSLLNTIIAAEIIGSAFDTSASFDSSSSCDASSSSDFSGGGGDFGGGGSSGDF